MNNAPMGWGFYDADYEQLCFEPAEIFKFNFSENSTNNSNSYSNSYVIPDGDNAGNTVAWTVNIEGGRLDSQDTWS
jgi:hypothetical protein